MIAFLKGHIEELQPSYVLLDVNGVGYRAEISLQTFDSLSAQGEDVKLLIYHHITENDQRLFGFYSKSEKALFEKLITVKGVGPKLGLTIVSGMEAEELISSIINNDVAGLSRIPGIGKKSAERIILELKDKLDTLDVGSGGASAAKNPGLRDEAVNALVALGFKPKEADQAVGNIIGAGITDLSQVIKQSLSLLNR